MSLIIILAVIGTVMFLGVLLWFGIIASDVEGIQSDEEPEDTLE